MPQSPQPRRDHLVRVAALLLSTGCLAAATPDPASGREPRAAETPQRWSGYPIRATGDADGGWIGGYRVDGTALYGVTPTRRPNRAGYRTPRTVGDLRGPAATRPETERAAWILSKYGDYRDPTQAAAVDAAVYHLLAGGRWRLGARRGARRIAQSGNPAAVARFVRIMLRQSRARAGAYTAELATSGADLGGAVTVTLSVRDGHGGPAAGLPVTLSMSGAQALTSVTGDDGRAVGRFAAASRGWQEVTATVGKVPDHRLHVWPPERKGQAAAAEGGSRRRVVVSARAPVRGQQTLSLAAEPAQLVVGSAARVVAMVAGGDVPRTAGAALHGPFPSATAADCSGSAVGAVSAPVASDGNYALPAVSVSGGGYYSWQVAVDGTETTMPVAACGATLKVRGRAATAISDVYVTGFGEVRATGTISGMPFTDQVTATGKLAGPYASAVDAAADDCATFDTDEATRARYGNGPVQFTVAPAVTGKYYAWIVETSPGDLWLGSRSTCAAQGTVLFVP